MKLLCVLFLSMLAFGGIHTPADISGDNAVHHFPFDATVPNATWIQIIVAGSGTVRVGDCSVVSSSRGLPIAAGGSMMFPYKGQLGPYSLNGYCAYIPSGATLSVGYED